MSEPESNDSSKPTEIIIARWTDRFFAWLIDFIIVAVVSFAIYLPVFSVNFDQITSGNFEASSYFEHGIISIAYFLYWLILEYKTGQSIGKRALHLKITDLKGGKADIISIAVSSFGKAFLLPIDVIIGRLFTNQNRQRIFNSLGKTIVIKVEPNDKPENVVYKKD